MTRSLTFLVVFTATVALPASACAATYHLSPTGSDANGCTADRPCRSLDRGYAVARPGDTVVVAAGSYGDQTIAWRSGRSAPNVEIKAAPGTVPVFGEVNVESSYVTLTGPFRSRTLQANGTGGNVVRGVLLQNFTVDGQGVQSVIGYIASADGVTFRNVDLSDVREVQGMITDGGRPGGVRNVLLDRVAIHDVYIAPNSPSHVECLGLFGGWNITIRNSHFYNCTTFDVFVTFTESGPETRFSKNVVLENNVFEETIGSGIPPNDLCCSHYNVMFREGAATADGAVLRNNTFAGALALSTETNWAVAPRLIGNIVDADCLRGATYRHNVTSRPCSSSDKRVSRQAIRAGFASPGAHDFRLRPGSPAIDAGDPSSYPATDRTGGVRPVGRAPDAGAYEFGSRPAGPGAQPPSPGNTGKRARRARPRLGFRRGARLRRKGSRVRISVRCVARSRCRATRLTLTAPRRPRLRPRHAKVPALAAGRRAVVRVRLPRRWMRAVQSAGRRGLRVNVRIGAGKPRPARIR